jgi:hypothetical protein
MPEDYEVKQGDCISSIATDRGFFWDTLWKHPSNASLKFKRKDPNVLMPGDIVHIPDLTIKHESGAAEQCHKFKLKGVPSKFRLKLVENGKPRAGERYILRIDGVAIAGNLDRQGMLEAAIPGDARHGSLVLGKDEQIYEFDLGSLDPIDEISGAQARLNNLGYDAGEADGGMNEPTTLALQHFQRDFALAETGEYDDATRSKLREIHGS